MPTSRKLSEPLPPKRWIVRLVVVDTPSSGEEYLTGKCIIDNVLKRDSNAGVEVIQEFASEYKEE